MSRLSGRRKPAPAAAAVHVEGASILQLAEDPRLTEFRGAA